jgi:hypothetical protein
MYSNGSKSVANDRGKMERMDAKTTSTYIEDQTMDRS